MASDILRYFPKDFDILYEPFAGSAAITIATAAAKIGKKYHINDLNKPLMDLWQEIIETPDQLAKEYERLWVAQQDEPKAFYNMVRAKFNLKGSSHHFLYLLARAVKGSIRYNSQGEFNQSPDNRRLGMKPATMKQQIMGVSRLLEKKTTVSSVNYRDILVLASPADLVYMDPPYQGVCGNRDTRYLQSIQYCEFVESLECLNKRNIRYLVSYDGRTGTKAYGKTLPDELGLELIEICAGRSSQATLLGRDDITYESLYLSPALISCFGTLPRVNVQYDLLGACK